MKKKSNNKNSHITIVMIQFVNFKFQHIFKIYILHSRDPNHNFSNELSCFFVS